MATMGQPTLDLTPEKVATMALRTQEHDGEVSRPSTPSGAHRSFEFGGLQRSSSRATTRSTRQVTRSSRRSSSFISSHRNKMSQELTQHAENHFLALIDFMANANREASSLKEFWAKITSERESIAAERDELLEQVTEITEQLEVRESEHHNRGNEAAEKKRQIDKLVLELSAAITNMAVEKKKVTDRDTELDRLRHELHTLKDAGILTQTESKRVRHEYEAVLLTLKTAEGDRNTAREDADKHRRELQRVSREKTETGSKLTDMISKFESSRKEVLSLTDRIKFFELERDEHLSEVDRLKDDLRKARSKSEESSRELIEVTEKHDRVHREVHQLKESYRTLELERDDHAHSLDHLRRDLKSMTTGRDEAEERTSEIGIKYEQIKRDLLGMKDKIRNVEVERNEITQLHERTREQLRLVIVERDELKDEIITSNREADDSRRNVVTITDALRKTESTLTEARSEVFALTERVKQVDIGRDDLRRKNKQLVTEISEAKEQIVLFQAEILSITDARDRARGELEKSRREYEEMTETITTFDDDSKEFEFEIDSLRTMLREAREQKERAILARDTADAERDEYIVKYEEKCREMERFEESAASHYHAHAKSSGGGESRTTSTRFVSKSSSNGTAVTNGHDVD